MSLDDNVYRIRGTYTGHGQGASIGPVYEREDSLRKHGLTMTENIPPHRT